jgi:hypothetical protein
VKILGLNLEKVGKLLADSIPKIRKAEVMSEAIYELISKATTIDELLSIVERYGELGGIGLTIAVMQKGGGIRFNELELRVKALEEAIRLKEEHGKGQ